MSKIYLEQVLEQLADKANVVIYTKETESSRPRCLGNHYAARWQIVLEEKFTCGLFGVTNITHRITGSSLTWVITIDRELDWLTDRLGTLSNCIIPELDY